MSLGDGGDAGAPGAEGISVFLDNSRDPDGRSLLFRNPLEIVRCDEPADLPAALAAVEAASRRGLYAAGYLSYELGYALEPKLLGLSPPRRRHPLLWMGLFARPLILDADAAESYVGQGAEGEARVSGTSLSVDRDSYLEAVRRVRDYIAAATFTRSISPSRSGSRSTAIPLHFTQSCGASSGFAMAPWSAPRTARSCPCPRNCFCPLRTDWRPRGR